MVLYSAGHDASAEFRRLPSPYQWLHRATGDLPDLNASRGSFDLRYPVGAATATAVAHQGSADPTLDILYHESFHVYQDDEFHRRPRPPGDVDTELVASPRFRALAEVERRVLRHALAADHEPALRSMLREYLVVRDHRAAMSPAAAETERVLERLEGSAEFVGYRATAAALGWDRQRVPLTLADDLARPPRRYGFGFEWDVRQRVYATGAALALLLDRLDVGWRDRIRRGDSFDEVLKEQIAVDTTAGALQATLARLGYRHILKEVEHDSTGPP